MAVNRGKQFEDVIKKSFKKDPDVSIDRLHDQTNGFAGSVNICDFIVYRKPYEYYIECKSVHGNTLPFSNISKNQWQGMLEKSDIKGVYAGVICWFIDKDVTLYIPIEILDDLKNNALLKSYRYNWTHIIQNRFKNRRTIIITGKKKRIFYDYDMEEFLNRMEKLDEHSLR